MIRFGLLGPATAWHDGREVDLGSPQQRALFAVLLLHRNETVATDRAIEALWPAGAPPNAVQVVRTYVSRLRGGPLDWADLVTHREGYELRASCGEVDADRLEQRVAAARDELARGDAVGAEALLTEALALVRGPPLPELPDDRAAAAERTRCDELRAGAEDELVEARLAQGRHLEILPTLRAAVTARPLRERSWEQLMVALYRSGRQAEALAAYRRARRALGELALEPGPTLRAVERMILLQDPELELPLIDEPRLPRPRTSFLGRDADVAAVEEGIADQRLVTVVGPAGVGKTRLAAEVAARAGGQRAGRVWWVDLARVGASRVTAATARALAVPQIPGRPFVDLILARLQEAPAVLVLDNCEHVVEETAQLATRLLDGDGRVRLLATSREPLRLDVERVHRLAGLERGPATRLLLDRAGSGEHEPAAVDDVIGRLDGLPLAIELAAGKLRSISAADLARGLRERLWLLSGGDPTIPLRQRTLETAIAWSHELLPTTEQRVLRRLAVFAGGFDAATAEAVASGDGIDRAAVLPALAHLVDTSLVVAEPARYRLLLTVRTFARERLADAGESEAVAERHRDAYLGFAEELSRQMTTAGLATWLPRGRREHENLLAALEWSLQQADGEPAARLAGSLSLFWFRIGFVRDGRELLERALAGAASSGQWLGRALVGRCALAHLAGAPDTSGLGDAAVAACEAEGAGDLLSFALCWRTHARIVAGRLEDARADSLRAHAVAAATGSEEGLGFSEQLLGNVLERAGDLTGAGEILDRSVERFRRLRAPLDAGYALVDLARVTLAQGRADDALRDAAAAVVDFRRREDPRGRAAACAVLGAAYARLGEAERAEAVLDEAAALSRRWGFALPVSRQVDEAREEPARGTRVEPLPADRAAAVLRVRGQE